MIVKTLVSNYDNSNLEEVVTNVTHIYNKLQKLLIGIIEDFGVICK